MYREDEDDTGGDGLGLRAGGEGEGGRGKAVTRGACLPRWPRFRPAELSSSVPRYSHAAPFLLYPSLPLSLFLSLALARSLAISLWILSVSVASLTDEARVFRPIGLRERR